MKNKLIDLNNHLFAQLERLSEEDLKGEELEKEVARTKAIANTAREIIENAKLVLEAKKAIKEWCMDVKTLPEILQIDKK